MPHNDASIRHPVRNAILSTGDCGVCDRHAAEKGVSGKALMDRAGHAMARAIMQRWAPRPVSVLCGPGNNGGDGFVCARNLHEAGWTVAVFLAGKTSDLKGDARAACEAWGGPVQPLSLAALDGAGLVVDAIFGAGLNRAPDGEIARVIDAVANSDRPVIAADLPSGVSGDTGRPLGVAVRADLTVTFHRAKPAHILEPGAGLCGEVVLADIGIPDSWRQVVEPVARLNTPDIWSGHLPVRSSQSHKHGHGRLAVFTGPASATGAARLAARAGLRAGAGLVTLVSPPGAVLVNATASTAVMVRSRASEVRAGNALGELKASCAVMGPAMGVGEDTRDAVLSALGSNASLVLDADALTSFEAAPGPLFAALRAEDVLTPHPGEFRRLFPDIADETGSRVDAARSAVERAGCTILLKGADTVIASPGICPVVNRHASPSLATAGSGDVLAGLIGGLMTQGMSGFEAACGGAWLHGDTALRLGQGLIAEDLVEATPASLQALHRHLRRNRALSHLL